jgi:hypothetical protein
MVKDKDKETLAIWFAQLRFSRGLSHVRIDRGLSSMRIDLHRGNILTLL